jgi:hypothetical protein
LKNHFQVADKLLEFDSTIEINPLVNDPNEICNSKNEPKDFSLMDLAIKMNLPNVVSYLHKLGVKIPTEKIKISLISKDSLLATRNKDALTPNPYFTSATSANSRSYST